MKDRYINNHTLAKHTQRKHREIERQKKSQKDREKKDKKPESTLKEGITLDSSGLARPDRGFGLQGACNSHTSQARHRNEVGHRTRRLCQEERLSQEILA